MSEDIPPGIAPPASEFLPPLGRGPGQKTDRSYEPSFRRRRRTSTTTRPLGTETVVLRHGRGRSGNYRLGTGAPVCTCSLSSSSRKVSDRSGHPGTLGVTSGVGLGPRPSSTSREKLRPKKCRRWRVSYLGGRDLLVDGKRPLKEGSDISKQTNSIIKGSEDIVSRCLSHRSLFTDRVSRPPVFRFYFDRRPGRRRL